MGPPNLDQNFKIHSPQCNLFTEIYIKKISLTSGLFIGFNIYLLKQLLKKM